MPEAAPGKIDAVVMWVDGEDPAFRARFAQALHAEPEDLRQHTRQAFDARHVSGHEIVLCLESIIRFGHAIDRIFVVTDGQNPLARFPSLRRHADRIQIVDHKVIFRDHLSALPSFSSRPISSLLWRIPGISPYFMYFNDDCILWSDLTIDQVMPNGQPMLTFSSRRHWKHRNPQDFSRYYTLRNAHKLLEHHRPGTTTHLPAHFPQLFSKRVFEDLFALLPEAWEQQIHTRFRSPQTGFVVEALHHAYLRTQDGVQVQYDPVGVFLGSLETKESFRDKAGQLFAQAPPSYLCVNDLPHLAANRPNLLRRIERHILGAPWPPQDSAAPG